MLLYYTGTTPLRSRVAQSIKLLREANSGQVCSRTSFFKPVTSGLVTGHNLLFAEVLAKIFTKIKKLSPFAWDKIVHFYHFSFFKNQNKVHTTVNQFSVSWDPHVVFRIMFPILPHCDFFTCLLVLLAFSLGLVSLGVSEYLEWRWPLCGHVWECLSFLSSSL